MSRVLPILFNTDMVRAILDGRKTVTRRVIKPRYKADEGGFQVCTNKATGVRWVEKADLEGGSFDTPRYEKSPYQSGDILYVRETWFYEHHMEDTTAGEPDLFSGRYSHRYVYRADNPDYPVDIGVGATGWHPSIHMPKEAARIWLKVTDVRVERLQDMSHDTPMKEGIHFCKCPDGFTWKIDTDMHDCYINSMGAMKALWDSTIKKSDLGRYGWDANPWVWVIEFERCGKPESEG